jgi:OmpA-OmpF porin, OOP family
MRRNLYILLLTVLYFNSWAQNYFSNHSFEEFFILPRGFVLIEEKNTEIIPRWFFLATPDYFHTLSKYKDVQIPKNFAGVQKPKHGRAYCGLILRADPEKYKLRNVPDAKHYSEHLQNILDKPLEKDQMYCCKVHLSLSDYSGLAVDGFGVYFSEELIIFEDKSDVLKYKPQIENLESNILSDTKKWMEYTGIFKAQGNEKYATFGNFKSLDKTNYIRLNPKKKDKMNLFAYYYIDNISLVPIETEDECICNMVSHTIVNDTTNYIDIETVKYATTYINNDDTIQRIFSEQFGTIEIGKPVTLKNIYFDFDKFDLLPESFKELDILYSILDSVCKSCTILIEGHTDSYGADEYNLKLSENRAQSVANYLISKGIVGKRISFKGYGSTFPIETNETDEGRQMNRRVNFIINKK